MSYRTIISSADLLPHLSAPNWVIVDCRFDLLNPDAGRAAFEQSHIPNARYADLNRDLSSAIKPGTGRHPLPDPQQLAQCFGAWGIGDNTQVVAYDDSGGAFAARLWWLLRWLGHDSVAVLDGGWKNWTAQQRPVTTERAHLTAASFTPQRRAMWIDAQTVRRRINDDGYMLIDVRAPDRYAGRVEPIDPVAGHIPGAHNIPFADNLNAQGLFKSPQELRALYGHRTHHLDPQCLTVMCGSGVTACHTLLALEIAGLSGAQLYAGSWSEWITDATRPVARD